MAHLISGAPLYAQCHSWIIRVFYVCVFVYPLEKFGFFSPGKPPLTVVLPGQQIFTKNNSNIYEAQNLVHRDCCKHIHTHTHTCMHTRMHAGTCTHKHTKLSIKGETKLKIQVGLKMSKNEQIIFSSACSVWLFCQYLYE